MSNERVEKWRAKVVPNSEQGCAKTVENAGKEFGQTRAIEAKSGSPVPAAKGPLNSVIKPRLKPSLSTFKRTYRNSPPNFQVCRPRVRLRLSANDHRLSARLLGVAKVPPSELKGAK